VHGVRAEHELYERFGMDLERLQDAALIQVRGEFDVAHEAALGRKIDSLVASGVRRIVIDLRRARFIDSQGVRVLASYELRSRFEGFQFAVIPAADGQIRRVFETMGIERLLTLRKDLEQLDRDGGALPS
jgi:anti-anti-sigma factor